MKRVSNDGVRNVVICNFQFFFFFVRYDFSFFVCRLAISRRRERRTKGPSIPRLGLVAVAVQETTCVEPLRQHEIRFRAETHGEYLPLTVSKSRDDLTSVTHLMREGQKGEIAPGSTLLEVVVNFSRQCVIKNK